MALFTFVPTQRQGEHGSQEQPIILSDSDDGNPRRRSVRSLPRRTTKVHITILSSPDDGSEVVETTGEAHRSLSSRKAKVVERGEQVEHGGRVTHIEPSSASPIKGSSRRKGKEVERDHQTPSRGAAAQSKPTPTTSAAGQPSRKGKEVERDSQTPFGRSTQAESSSPRKSVLPPLRTPKQPSISSDHTTQSENPPPLEISFPVRSPAEGLVDLVNRARAQSGSTSTWEYVKCPPPSGSSADRAFRCTYPSCRSQIGFRDKEGKRRIWYKIPRLVDVHNHEHPPPPPTRTRNQPPASSSLDASRARTITTPRTAIPQSITRRDKVRDQRDETIRKSTPHLQSPIKPKSSPAERILHVPVSASHSATRKPGPTTPQSRHKRLHSAVSISTPSPRQISGAGGSGLGENPDSPEEEEEQVENLPPSMPGSQQSRHHHKLDKVGEVEEEDDLVSLLDYD